jgi:hypothetical protein
LLSTSGTQISIASAYTSSAPTSNVFSHILIRIALIFGHPRVGFEGLAHLGAERRIAPLEASVGRETSEDL